MKNKKTLLTCTLLLFICLACIFNVFAHSGRTDGSGGHRDNQNKSGLGYYHYHCGGYPAHLHTNGVCPYTSSSSSSSNSTSSTSKYDEGYEDGYEKGYDEGHNEGYKERSKEVTAERKKEINMLLISVLVIGVIVLIVKFIKKRRRE